MADHVGGHIKMMFDNLASAMNQHNAGKIKILAICTQNRSPFLPEMQTMIEAGVPGFVSVAWFAMAAPAGTPDPIIAKINKDINTVLASEDLKTRYKGMGVEPIGNSVEYMANFFDQQRKLWAGVIKDSNIPQVE